MDIRKEKGQGRTSPDPEKQLNTMSATAEPEDLGSDFVSASQSLKHPCMLNLLTRSPLMGRTTLFAR